MSKLKMNATCIELVSTLKLDEIRMLQRTNSPALTIRDKDDNCIFKLLAGNVDGLAADGLMFSKCDMNGYAVMAFPFDAGKDADKIYEHAYNVIGAKKGYLDQIEPVAAAAVRTENERKNAFITELRGETAAV